MGVCTIPYPEVCKGLVYGCMYNSKPNPSLKLSNSVLNSISPLQIIFVYAQICSLSLSNLHGWFNKSVQYQMFTLTLAWASESVSTIIML